MKIRWFGKALLTVIVVAALVGSAFALQAFSNGMIHNVALRLFVDDGVDASTLQQDIASIDGVRDTSLIDKEQAFGLFRDVVGEEWSGSNPLPDVLEVVVDPSFADEVHNQLQSYVGIDYIVYDRALMRTVAVAYVWLTGIRFGLLLVTAVILFRLSLALLRRPFPTKPNPKEHASCVPSASSS